MINKRLPIYNIKIDDFDDETGIQLISLVDQPAVETDFIALSKAKRQLLQNEEKHIVTGPVLIPDQLIYRNDREGEYYIRYDADTIFKIMNKFFKKGFPNITNINHDDSILSDKNYLIESWIIDDPNLDKSKVLGFDLPKGTFMATYKIEDDITWNKIKNGEIKGFSLEGYFYQELSKETKPKQINSDKIKELKSLVNQALEYYSKENN